MSKKPKIWSNFIQMPESAVIIGIAAVLIVFAFLTNGSWFNAFTITRVLRTTSLLGIVAIGQALLIISGEFDLSVGSIYGFSGLMYIWLSGGLKQVIYDLVPTGVDLGPIPAAIIVLIFGLAIGAIHGFLVTKLRMPSMIVTLGSLFVFRGIVYLSSGGYPLSLTESLKNNLAVKVLGGGNIRSLDVSVLWLIFLMVIFAVILNFTKYGNQVQAVGRDPLTALSLGISPKKIKLMAFVICTVLAALAGILTAGYYSSIEPNAGNGMEFESVAAAVLGGCIIGGGIGSIWGTVLGAFLLATVWNGLMYLAVPAYWYQTFVGVIFILIMISKKYVGSKI